MRETILIFWDNLVQHLPGMILVITPTFESLQYEYVVLPTNIRMLRTSHVYSIWPVIVLVSSTSLKQEHVHGLLAFMYPSY